LFFLFFFESDAKSKAKQSKAKGERARATVWLCHWTILCNVPVHHDASLIHQNILHGSRSNSATQQSGGVGPYAGVWSKRPESRRRSLNRPLWMWLRSTDGPAARLWLLLVLLVLLPLLVLWEMLQLQTKGASTSARVSAGGPGTYYSSVC
jgi:hypothetical protein